MLVKQKMPDNLVITEFINNMVDSQHNVTSTNTDFEHMLIELIKSVSRFDIKVVLLTNVEAASQDSNFLVKTMALNKNLSNLSLYFYRWIICYEFLLDHPEIKKAALVDATDVEMLNYPFDEVQPGTLYIGDELSTLRGYIIQDDIAPAFVSDYINANLDLQLLNAGVLVGDRSILLEFLGMVIKTLTDNEVLRAKQPESSHFGKYEMTIMNYVAYKYFNTRIYHGRKVNTLFTLKVKRGKSWFRHK